MDEGYAATQMLSQLHESIIEKDLGDKQKSAITEKMAVSTCLGNRCNVKRLVPLVVTTHISSLYSRLLAQVASKCLSDGADEYLQMLSLCSVIMQQSSQD